MWRIPSNILSSGNDDDALNHVLEQLKDPEQFRAKVSDLYAHPGQESFDTIEFKDGRIFERYSRPQLVEGQTIGRVWSFRRRDRAPARRGAAAGERGALFASSRRTWATWSPMVDTGAGASTAVPRFARSSRTTRSGPARTRSRKSIPMTAAGAGDLQRNCPDWKSASAPSSASC